MHEAQTLARNLRHRPRRHRLANFISHRLRRTIELRQMRANRAHRAWFERGSPELSRAREARGSLGRWNTSCSRGAANNERGYRWILG